MKTLAAIAFSTAALAATFGFGLPAEARSDIGVNASPYGVVDYRDARYDRDRYRQNDYDRSNWSAGQWRYWCRSHKREHHLCDRWNNGYYQNDYRDDRYGSDRYGSDGYRQNDYDRSDWSADQWRDWCRDHRREHGLCDRWNRY